MTKWFEYDTYVYTLDGSMSKDEAVREKMNERGRWGWKLAYCIPIVDDTGEDPNKFTLVFERERDGEPV